MKKEFILKILVALFVSLPVGVYAQNGMVKGIVTGDGTPLAGASVMVGTNGVITNDEGYYSIRLKAGQQIVSANYVGYQSVTTTINVIEDQTVTLNFSLKPNSALSEVVVIGSRATPRTQLTSAVPVDVIDISKLAESAPQVSLNQILNYAAPSFSSNTQSLGDGTDHIDPASLRGLGPDQVLVLINGKRRHTSSLVNVNGTFGKGTVGTDLNAIPVSAIEKIEILRDGASAQYGSDAIAGVINIVLKKTVNQLNASVTGGQYSTKSNGIKYNDGKTVQVALDYGLPVGERGGYINFAGSYDYREPTNRAGAYQGPIYQTYPGGLDKTDSFLQATNTTRRDYSLVVGQSQLRSGQFFYNSSIPVSANAELYSFGGLGYRKGLSPGFYRYPNNPRNVLDIYPLGFLPYIGSDIFDRSVSVGIRGKANDWDVDFSNTYGQNQFIFGVENSLNASLLKASPTSFNAGGPKFVQNTINADVSRTFDWLSGTNIAFGSEYRFERYELIPGDENSYTNYGTARQVGIDANNEPILIPDPTGPINTLFGPDGSPRPGGSQVFPGFRPKNAINESRNSIAAYADIEINLTRAFMADAAVRFENYSDFGSTTNGKLAFRYKVTERFVLRASGSTGFRAPSLQQRYYANTATVFSDGVPNDVGVFPNNSRAARLVGIPSLVPERSKSVSAGFTGDLGAVKFTVDGYVTRIDDRVIYTDQFSGSNAPGASEADKELYQILLQANATRAQFFANAINTETKGIDAVISYSKTLGAGQFRADLSGTISKTKQVGDIKVSDLLKGKESTYFSNSNRVYLENAVPNEKANLTLNYSISGFNIFLRNNYFGGVTEPTNIIENQQFYDPRVVTDISLGYKITPQINVTIGSNNVLDVYPEKVAIKANSGSGQYIYSRGATQFGFNGRYVFGRIDITL